MSEVRASGSRSLLDKIVSKINAARPENEDSGTFEVVRSRKSILSRIRHVLMTGIPSFDRATGGFPFQRMTEVFGLETSGKTALVKLACLRAQQRFIYEKVYENDNDNRILRYDQIPANSEVLILYLDNEQSIDDDDKIEFTDPVTKEKVLMDIALGRCDTVDQMFKIFDRTLDGVETHIADSEEKKKKEVFVVIITDTIAGTSSKEEMKAEWNKDDYPRQPKELRRGFRRLIRRFSRLNVCAIFTNQISDNFTQQKKGNTPSANDFSTFGGRALKYYSSLRIFTFAVNLKYVLKKGARFAAGILIGFTTPKNRQVKPFREGRMALLFEDGIGIEPNFSTLEQLIFLGFADVAEKGGTITFRFDKAGITTTTFPEYEAQVASSKEASKALDDDDDAARGKKKKPKLPTIAEKYEWPEFYKAHSADFDALWEKAIEYLFATEGMSDMQFLQDDEGSGDDMDDLIE